VVLIYFFAFKIKIGNQINFFSSMKSCDSAWNEWYIFFIFFKEQ
jgi:hypothetical protein